MALILLSSAAPLLFAHGDMHERIVEITAQIEKQPGNAELHFKRGELHRHHGGWPAALADYDRAEALESGLAVHFGRGCVLYAQGKMAEAITALDRCLAATPDHVEALVTRARARVQLGERSAAAADYDRAIALSPDPEPDHFLERARALAEETPPRFDDAARGLEIAMSRLGTIPSLGLALCDIEVQRGNFDAALALLDKLRAPSKRQESWLARRGEILLKAGRTNEAVAAFKEAIAAIDSLPAHLRSKQATSQLKARLREQVRLKPM